MAIDPNQKSEIENRKCPAPGIYPGIPFAEYHRWEAVNSTFLAALSKRTPHHAKHDKDHPKDSDARRIGRATHSLILEPATFTAFWCVLPEDAPRRPSDRQRNAKNPSPESVKAIEFWDAVNNSGREIVTAKEYAEIETMAGEVRKQQCRELITSGVAEVCIVWRDEETGVLCKRRLDYERRWLDDEGRERHFITDVKTSDDISERAFGDDVANYRYALAAAFSIDGWSEARRQSGKPPEESVYTLLAVEKGYNVTMVWEPDAPTIKAGRNDYRRALIRTAECMKAGKWPAYGPSPKKIRAAEWYLRQNGVGPFDNGEEE